MSTAPIVLREGNYTAWAAQTKAALHKAGAWHHVANLIPSPGELKSDSTSTDRQEYRLHHENEGKALGCIMEHLSPANLRLINSKTAKEAWDELQKVHAAQTPHHQYLLFQKLLTKHQSESEPLTSFHARIQTAADELTASIKDTTKPSELVDMFAAFIC